MSVKSTYISLCEQHENIPMFSTPNWLNAVCGEDGWDVVLAHDKEGHIVGSWAFHLVKKGPFRIILNPMLTPFSGPRLFPHHPITRPSKKRSFAIKTIASLYEQLPKHDYILVNLYPDMNDWYPLYCIGFKSTIRQTFQLAPNSSEYIWKQFGSGLRNKIKKQEEKYHIKETTDIATIYRMQAELIRQKGEKMLAEQQFRQLLASLEYGWTGLMAVTQKSNEIAGSCFVVHDKDTSYLTFLNQNNSVKHHSCSRPLIWESIKTCHEKGKVFDFEGSMLPSVEPVFRSFEGRTRSYHSVSKSNNLLFESLFLFRESTQKSK